MATQGQFNTSAWEGTNGNRYLTFYWKVSSVDVANQTTTIYWWVMMNGTNRNKVTCEPFQINIDGDLVYWSDTRTKYDLYVEICDGYKTIKHNEDGTKTFNVSVRAAIYSSSVNCTGTKNYDLDVVGKARITAAPNFTDEDNPTIEYYNPVGNAISSLSAAISLTGENPDIPYREVAINGTNYTFTLSDTERNTLRAATQGRNDRLVWFYLRSIIDGEYFFSAKEVVFTVINAYPSIGISVVDANTNTIALTGDKNTLVKYHSTAVANITAAAYKEAYITEHYIEHAGTRYTEETKVFPNVESNDFTFIAIDSRNNIESEHLTPKFVEYIKPTVNIENGEQMTTEGTYTIKCAGNYFNNTFGDNAAAAVNMLSVQYRYKPQGGEYGDWAIMTVSVPGGNTYTAEKAITGLDYRTAYIFQCRAVDSLNTILSAEITVRSLPVFHWGENDFVFEVPVYFNAGFNGEGEIPGSGGGSATSEPCAIQNGKYEGDLQITGDLWLKNDTDFGNSIYFGDKSYVSISEATDNTFTIKATKINLDGQVAYNGSSIEGVWWSPTIYPAQAVSSYTVQQGWAQKFGSVVTIGWQVKADIKSGYDNTVVQIHGCPYKPYISGFGGGVAHNITLGAGFNFEGYSIGTDGIITLRGQPCNNTTKGNLQITSAVYYPTATGTTTITLAGTLSFITFD